MSLKLNNLISNFGIDGKKKTLKDRIRTILKRLSGDDNDENNLINMLNDVLNKNVKVKLNEKYEVALKLIAEVRVYFFFELKMVSRLQSNSILS